MKILDLLRKLGILRFGATGGTYRNAVERPTELQMDDVFDARKDLAFGAPKRTCPRCRKEADPGARFCAECGAALES